MSPPSFFPGQDAALTEQRPPKFWPGVLAGLAQIPSLPRMAALCRRHPSFLEPHPTQQVFPLEFSKNCVVYPRKLAKERS